MSHAGEYSQVRYSQEYRRGRFYNFPMADLHLSSRFGTVPLSMERDPYGEFSHQESQQPSARRAMNPFHPLPPIGGGGGSVAMETAVASLLNGLYNRLPPYTSRLTGSPVVLSRDEEYAVMRELQNQLRYLDMSKLKQVYSELATGDDELAGVCTLEELNQAFLRNNILLSNPLLRLVASAFLSPHDPLRLNYEKVLSFIGASIQLGLPAEQPDSSGYYLQQQQRQSAPDGYPGVMYYHPDYLIDQHHHQLPPPPSPPPSTTPPASSRGGDALATGMSSDRDLPRALRQLESEVAALVAAGPQDKRLIRFESLRLAFQRADRLMRGTLGPDQMKRLVWDFGLGLSEPLLDSLVSLCRHRGGGQYDWEQFVGLLERGVAPHSSTGLRIPASRQPLEYARQLPQPTPSWPQAEHSQQLQPQSQQNGGLQQPLYRTPSPQPMSPHHPHQQQHQHRGGPAAAAPPMAEPWFNRFMKLADAVYRRDSEARGFVSESDVKDLIYRYNAEYQLGIQQAAVQSAIDASRSAPLGGRININELLKRLGVRPIGA